MDIRCDREIEHPEKTTLQDDRHIASPYCTFETKKNFGLYIIRTDKSPELIRELPDDTTLFIKVGYGLEISLDKNMESLYRKNSYWVQNAKQIQSFDEKRGIIAIMAKDATPEFESDNFECMASYYSGILNDNRMFKYEKLDTVGGSHFGRDGSLDVYYVTLDNVSDGNTYLMRVNNNLIVYTDDTYRSNCFFDSDWSENLNINQYGEYVKMFNDDDILNRIRNSRVPGDNYDESWIAIRNIMYAYLMEEMAINVENNLFESVDEELIGNYIEQIPELNELKQYYNMYKKYQDQYFYKACLCLHGGEFAYPNLTPADVITTNDIINGTIKNKDYVYMQPVVEWDSKKELKTASFLIDDLFPFTKILKLKTIDDLKEISRLQIQFPRLNMLIVDCYPNTPSCDNLVLAEYVMNLPITRLQIKSGAQMFIDDYNMFIELKNGSYTKELVQTTKNNFILYKI
jgi:hypothetical protein